MCALAHTYVIVPHEATDCFDIGTEFSPSPLAPLLNLAQIKRPNINSQFGDSNLKILLYNPDNGVTRNFMPHLWMFLLQSITPPGHEVLLVDGNAHAMNEEELV